MAFSSVFALRDIDGRNGFKTNEFSGASRFLDSVGDINNDGIDDFIVNAPGSSGRAPSLQESYVVFGRNTVFAEGARSRHFRY